MSERKRNVEPVGRLARRFDQIEVIAEGGRGVEVEINLRPKADDKQGAKGGDEGCGHEQQRGRHQQIAAKPFISLKKRKSVASDTSNDASWMCRGYVVHAVTAGRRSVLRAFIRSIPRRSLHGCPGAPFCQAAKQLEGLTVERNGIDSSSTRSRARKGRKT